MTAEASKDNSTVFYTNEELFHALTIRKSTRTYSGVELKPEHIKLIKNYLQSDEKMIGPFGDTFRIEFMNGVDTDEQIATYGYIKEFKAILMAISKPEPSALFEMAYVLHGLVLQLTQADVQTVWLGGAFNHKDAIDASTMQKDEIIAAVIPLGYESSKKRLLFDYIAPIILGAKHRKNMNDVYFKNDFNTPLNEADTKFYEVLDLARRAPLVKNK
jgi:putative nitroreductase